MLFDAPDKPSASSQSILKYNGTNITDMSSSNNSTFTADSGKLITPIPGALKAAEAAEHTIARKTNVASNTFGVQVGQEIINPTFGRLLLNLFKR